MRLPIYQVDAFTGEVFHGNPAALVPLETWLSDAVLQAIAEENNLSETAFFAPDGDHLRLRWFTPTTEVDLCGHATLASAWLIFNRLKPELDRVAFATRSGVLTVARTGEGEEGAMRMDFPARPASPVAPCAGLIEALGGGRPKEILASRDYLIVYDDPGTVRSLKPDLAAIAKADRFAVIVTAPGDGPYDCVSRFFAPARGVPEDPVTGSAHCSIAPYWAGRLGKGTIHAYQASRRGGEMRCSLQDDRVLLEGRCAFYLEGAIHI